MICGFITVVVNWVLLVIVLNQFTPVVFVGTSTVPINVVYYSVIVLHFVATSALGLSMILRSILCPKTNTESYTQMTSH